MAISAIAALTMGLSGAVCHAETATGVVFHDTNRNERLDADESGIAGVAVSNGSDVVLTDEEGAYELPVGNDTILFVNKPAGWMTPVNAHQLPQFFYVHKPGGSPELDYPGVEPTGPLPEAINFPLYRNEGEDRYKVLLFGDTQVTTIEQIYWLAEDVIPELADTDADFAISLGDLVNNKLELFEPLNAVNAKIGIPFYNVIGNHDLNFDVDDDAYSDETFERVYGPPYYGYTYGDVTFLTLDNVIWTGDGYHGGLGEKQLAFIENFLDTIPKDHRIVLTMHIPLTDTEDTRTLFELLKPFPLTFSVSAHRHRQEHLFLDEEDGWQGEDPHHHLIHVTVCGSWWNGPRGEFGVPVTTMSDGVPNGYSFMDIDGTDYEITYKAAGFPADFQMKIHAPDEARVGHTGDAKVVVNVFGGSERSAVQMRVNEGPWTALAHAPQADPHYLDQKEREAWLQSQLAKAADKNQDGYDINRYPGARENYGTRLPSAHAAPHIWEGTLPEDLPEGIHTIEVRTTDMFGHTFKDERYIRVY